MNPTRASLLTWARAPCQVRDLRQARGVRLGAAQRKYPTIGIGLLYVLAVIVIFPFPLLAAGTASLSEDPELKTVSILELQAVLFGSLCACVVLVIRIIEELWQERESVFKSDEVLEQLVQGLAEELQARESDAVYREPGGSLQ